MTLTEIFILAIALAMDALIVSFSYGLVINKQRFITSIAFGLFFGLFQFLMPIFGWYLTGFVYSEFENFSKRIVFFIFFILGSKFLKDAFENDESPKVICISLLCLIMLSFSTSIDALAAGVTIKFKNADIVQTSRIIGITTAILSVSGFWIANALKKLPSKYLEILGGLILLYLAFKSII